MNNIPEHIALAAHSNQGIRPRLIEFYGYEGEDFRHFQEIIEAYMRINNINTDDRKLMVLEAQLRSAAKTQLELELQNNINLTYADAIQKLKDYYITPELIESYELEFSELKQGIQEHPKIFLARIREAAKLANITGEKAVQRCFRAGLLREIKQFCIQSSPKNFQDWIDHANGWWSAYRPRKIAMVDNPFIARNINQALIYNDEVSHPYNNMYLPNHNVEIIDTNERPIHYLPAADVQQLERRNSHQLDPRQLNTMEILGQPNNAYYQIYDRNQNARINARNIEEMIQNAVRKEVNNPNHVFHRNINRTNNRTGRYINNRYSNTYNGSNEYSNNNNRYNEYNNYTRQNNYNRNDNNFQNSQMAERNTNRYNTNNNYRDNNTSNNNQRYEHRNPFHQNNNQQSPAKN